MHIDIERSHYGQHSACRSYSGSSKTSALVARIDIVYHVPNVVHRALSAKHCGPPLWRAPRIAWYLGSLRLQDIARSTGYQPYNRNSELRLPSPPARDDFVCFNDVNFIVYDECAGIKRRWGRGYPQARGYAGPGHDQAP